MDVFVNALEGYPIQSGFILIGLGIIFLLFRLDHQKREKYKDKNIFGKKSVINTWGIIVFLILAGLILILKNI